VDLPCQITETAPVVIGAAGAPSGWNPRANIINPRFSDIYPPFTIFIFISGDLLQTEG
jgi:hypothetical protein